MYKKCNFLFWGFIFILSFFISGTEVFAASSGTIDPNSLGYSKAYLVNSGGINGGASREVNTGNFTTQAAYNVLITDSVLTGWMWGQSTGWISLNCSNTSSCGSSNYKVSNDGNGNLSGYAWGPQAGWVNFAPTGAGTNTVKINSSGDFTGYAWSQVFGYISFNCSNDSSCGTVNFKTNTDYRPASARPACDNNIDDDGDTLVDYPTDAGCTSLSDTDESGPGVVALPPPPPAPPATPTPPTPPTSPTTPTTPTPTTPTPPTTPPSGSGTNPIQPPISPTSPSTPPGTSPTSPASPSTPGVGTGGGTVSTGNLNPFVMPPILELLINQAVGSFNDTLSALSDVRTEIGTLLNDPTANSVTKTVAVVGVVSGAVATVGAALFLNPVSFTELFFVPFRIWSLLLVAFGLKKRTRPWGTVYDSITKQPLDPAYVVLQDMQGNEIATSITDLDGRYGFLVPPGTYKLLAHKTNYIFPTRKLAEKKSDELYQDLYHGETVTITHDGEVVTKNIPMDPEKFDWNEFVKREQSLMKFHRRRDFVLERISSAIFLFGFGVAALAAFAAPEVYNLLILGLYVVMAIVRRLAPGARARGSMTYTDGTPISYGILRVYTQGTDREVLHKVADPKGNYYCLVQNGIYYVTIEKKNVDETYTKIFTSEPIQVRKGIINTDFKIR